VSGITTRLSACPQSVQLEFLTRPPNPMYAMQDYPTDYLFAMNVSLLNHVADNTTLTDWWDVPHANIHSCFATVGFCTPFVANTPGLRYARIRIDHHWSSL
jgi:hypothetical protein